MEGDTEWCQIYLSNYKFNKFWFCIRIKRSIFHLFLCVLFSLILLSSICIFEKFYPATLAAQFRIRIRQQNRYGSDLTKLQRLIFFAIFINKNCLRNSYITLAIRYLKEDVKWKEYFLRSESNLLDKPDMNLSRIRNFAWQIVFRFLQYNALPLRQAWRNRISDPVICQDPDYCFVEQGTAPGKV